MKANLIEVSENSILLEKPLIDLIVKNHGTLEKHIFSLGDDLYMFGHMTVEDKAFYFKTTTQKDEKPETAFRIRRTGTTSDEFFCSGHNTLKTAMKELTETAKVLNNGSLTYHLEEGNNGQTIREIATLTKKDGIQISEQDMQ